MFWIVHSNGRVGSAKLSSIYLGGNMATRYRRKLTFLGLTVLVWLASIHQLNAQVISGDLVGTIFDKTGAVVPDARVEATKADTGVTYETKSSDTGEYRFK